MKLTFQYYLNTCQLNLSKYWNKLFENYHLNSFERYLLRKKRIILHVSYINKFHVLINSDKGQVKQFKYQTSWWNWNELNHEFTSSRMVPFYNCYCYLFTQQSTREIDSRNSLMADSKKKKKKERKKGLKLVKYSSRDGRAIPRIFEGALFHDGSPRCDMGGYGAIFMSCCPSR